jgi:Protein of unknown function (DUF3572)
MRTRGCLGRHARTGLGDRDGRQVPVDGPSGPAGRFLALTGIGPESIRAAAHEPQFLLGVLDHLAGEEPLLLAFAAENAIPPSAVMEARDTIAGRRWERDTA